MTKKPVKTSHFKWTPKRRLFVKVMPGEGFNATKSVIKAGYSKKSAGKIATELMQIPQIKNAVMKEQQKVLWEAGVTVERVLKEIMAIAFMKITDHMKITPDGAVKLKTFARMTEEAIRAIAGVSEDTWITKGKGGDVLLHRKVTYKFHDKLRALEDLGKKLQMFVQKIDLSGDLDLVAKFNLKQLRDSFEELVDGRKSGSKRD